MRLQLLLERHVEHLRGEGRGRGVGGGGLTGRNKTKYSGTVGRREKRCGGFGTRLFEWFLFVCKSPVS